MYTIFKNMRQNNSILKKKGTNICEFIKGNDLHLVYLKIRIDIVLELPFW